MVMGKNSEPRITRLSGKSPSEKLDELNAEFRNHPRAFRRAIEADLEAKSKRKRKAEAPISSSLKPWI